MSNEATAQQWAAVPSADFSCNINGIPLQTRAHYHQLVAALIRAIDEKRELPDGYAFRINSLGLRKRFRSRWNPMTENRSFLIRVDEGIAFRSPRKYAK